MPFPTVERHLLRLRLTRPARFHFLHGGALRGAFSAALGRHQLPPGLVPIDCEKGSVRFEPGEPYHLGVTLLGEERRWLDPLVEGLERVGRDGGGPGRGPLPRLAGNFTVEAVEAVPTPSPEAVAATLAGQDELTLQLVTPLRLERPPSLKVAGAGYLNQDCFPADHFLDRLWNRCFFAERGRYPTARERDRLRPPLPRSEQAEPQGLFWLDMPVEGDPRKERPYTLGGVLGRVALAAIDEAWLPYLALGELLHVGSNVHFGFGRYLVRQASPPAEDPFRPARSFLERASSLEVLEEAFDHVVESSEAPGVDGVAPQELAGDPLPLLNELSRDLRSGRYRASLLQGVVLRKEDGGLRPLAIPTVRDRIAQRAASQVLAPGIDTLLEDASYAYRKGFSRAGAARAIQRAYEDGYRYVLDADITAFFDAVDRERLRPKLEALYPGEPLLQAIDAWMAAPVELEGRRIHRGRGLPQGSPLSPLLSNLYLDELDEELLGQDFRLVRYADNFVVLARDLDEARRARDAAREALTELRLELNEDETAIHSIDDGFSYLGYLFCRSLVLEQDEEPEAADGAPRRRIEPDDVPRYSWLAEVPFEELRELAGQGKPRGAGRRSRQPPRVEVVPLATGPAVAQALRRPLYVSSHEASLSLDNGAVTVELPEREPLRVPIRSLSHVVFTGRSRATVPLLLAISREGVPVFFCRRSGELYATLEPQEPDWKLWLHQARMAEDPSASVELAREVVAARLHNCATLLVRFGWQGGREAADALRDLERSCANQSTRASLLGLEGSGAERFFRSLAETLAPEWGFRGRAKRPPPDPVNAMLSFGYTLLHNHVSTALVAAGLNPRIGIYHREHGTHHALASDLVEEFRHLAEATAWSFVSRRRAQPADFAPSPDGRYPCLLGEGLRKELIASLERRLQTVFTPEGEEATTYRAYMARQARRLARLLRGETSRYRALRLQA